ncbi:MAG: uroporphyrinogen-III C-methyltransferase [Rhodospirillaceae bacterium]
MRHRPDPAKGGPSWPRPTFSLPVPEPGWVWLVGAGPGDPGLITLLGAKALEQADVVIHDALVDPHLLSLANPEAEIIFAGKRGGRPSPSQPDISNRLVAEARLGRRVVRLKGGDPFVFGRGAEEAQVLAREGIPFRIVPGITAGVGGLAYAGIPATAREVNAAVTFVTGHAASGDVPDTLDWQALARNPVLVFYMALKHLPVITEKLVQGGAEPNRPAAFVADGSLPTQRVIKTTIVNAVKDRDRHAVKAPALFVVGSVVGLSDRLSWFLPEQATGDGALPGKILANGSNR